MTKLTNKKIQWLVNQKDRGEKNPKLAKSLGICERRVQQIYKAYKLTRQIPMLKEHRRPKTYLTPDQCKLIDEVFHKYKLGARLLKKALDKEHPGNNIPYNKISAYLKKKGWSSSNPKKQRKRKRCRYERSHSGSLLHGDSHRTTENHPYAIAWLDDASRKVLGGLETSEPTTNEHSIQSFNMALQEAHKYNVDVNQVNTDRGTEFKSNKKEYNKNSKSKFELFLEEKGIQHVPSRRQNPQTNGKLERFWYEYDKHRWKFNSLEEFIEWYNNRIHGALKLEWGETPNEAFIRKLRPETLIGLMFKEE